MKRALAVVTVAAVLTGCLSASVQQNSYYTMHCVVELPSNKPVIPGLIRVRTLDVAKAYDKFQLVVRRSPYELRYAPNDVWAVKPQRMVADLVAQTLENNAVFGAVSRDLGDARPKFSLDGDIQAIEIYDSDDIWFAHLAISLRISRFSSGTVLWDYHFDQRKPVQTLSYSVAVRTLSELMTLALNEAALSMDRLRPGKALPQSPADPGGAEFKATQTATTPVILDRDRPIFVPERGRTADPDGDDD